MRFDRLPFTLRTLAANALGYKKAFGRFGPEYREMRKFLQETECLPAPEQEEWQRRELHRLLESARSGTDHYRGLEYDPDLPLDEVMTSLPLLEKATLRADPGRLFNRNERAWARSSTSGTTGSPLHVEHGRRATQRRFAVTLDHRQRHGVDRADPTIRLSGRIIADPSTGVRRPWLQLRATNQLLMSTYHLDSRHASVIGDKVMSFRPKLMDGYPTAIRELLRLLDSKGHRLSSLQAIVPTAETLDPELRAELEDLGDCLVLDYYSASEGTPMVQQCSEGTYHVRWQTGLYEVRQGDDVRMEGDGELIATSLSQDRTLLIRYCTGDFARGLKRAGEHPCACGLLTPTLEAVEGRVEDQVLTRDGRRIGMFPYRTLKEVEGLDQAQIRQQAPDRFKVLAKLEVGAVEGKVADQIRTRFSHVVGYPIELEFEVVDTLPRGANGKLRALVNEIEA